MVLDASVVVGALLSRAAADRLEGEVGHRRPYAPELIDVEVLSSLRRRVRRGQVPEALARRLVLEQSRSALRRVNHARLLPAAWELRHNLTASDALYVALARTLGVRLVTSDARLAGAPGLGIAVTVLPAD